LGQIDWLSLTPSPIQTVQLPLLAEKGVELLVKRDDLLHPQVSGNKWRKLKYNLLAANASGYSKLVTYGGAFSNHIAAVAAAGKALGFQTFGVIRGEASVPLNPTLQFAAACGMELQFISRQAYRTADRLDLAQTLFPFDFYWLPEGGTNALAIKGCEEIIAEVVAQFPNTLPNYFCLACGTGGTLAGVITGLQGQSQVIGFSALKGDFLTASVQEWLSPSIYTNWYISTDYHFGGYAKFQPELIALLHTFRTALHLTLDPIYTGKAMFGILDLVQKDYFPRGSTILMIHTGGLQGIAGFNARFGNLL